MRFSKFFLALVLAGLCLLPLACGGDDDDGDGGGGNGGGANICEALCAFSYRCSGSGGMPEDTYMAACTAGCAASAEAANCTTADQAPCSACLDSLECTQGNDSCPDSACACLSE